LAPLWARGRRGWLSLEVDEVVEGALFRLGRRAQNGPLVQRVGGGDFLQRPAQVGDAEGCGSCHAGELVVVQEDDSTTAYQAAEVDALSFTRIQAGAATTAVGDSISSHVLFVII